MPRDSGLAFVVVLHLDPKHESHAAQVLAPHTGMQVMDARHGMRVEADRVYVVVPDRSLSIANGKLQLGALSGDRANRRPIDVFFESLAEAQRERAIGIILSGTGTNGTAGVLAIKVHGGMTMAQDPETAEFDGMPRSAIAVGAADYILVPEAMPKALLEYARHPYVTVGERSAALEAIAGEPVMEILALLHVRTGHDLRGYRKGTLVRRIHRRMGLVHVHRLKEYAALLRESPDEIKALVRDLIINVTRFFRDPEAWDLLRKDVLVPLFARRPESIRAWVPGCATGEEAYSLAMLLVEEAERAQHRVNIQVFATDAMPDVLDRARSGLYPASGLGDIPPERLQRFFAREDDSYRAKPELRELLTFAPQNLLQDPPFSKLDLVSCRNVLIYLEPETQQKLISLLNFALRDEGVLFLGSAETVGRELGLFEPVSKRWRIYRRVGPARRGLLDFPLAATAGRARRGEPASPVVVPRITRLTDEMRQALLERYTPAAVLIDESYRVLNFHGRTDLYLSYPAGEPTSDALMLVREGLRAKLRSAVQQALRQERAVIVHDARARRGETVASVTIEVLPLKGGGEGSRHLLVAFRDEPESAAAVPRPPAPEGSTERELEAELRTTRDELHTTIEELEASNEELKASNEEVLSINEELQASNEELETSKEELQSLNEELSTVNSQLQSKVDELEAATNDLSNLLASTEIATIFLDSQFRIRSFTPATNRLFDILPADAGRPIHHFAQKFSGGDLTLDAREVLERLVPVEREVESTAGRWYLRRSLPYRTRDNRIEGVVVTFVDITERKLTERVLEGRVDQRTGMLKLLQEVAAAANEAKTVEEALSFAVRRVAEYQGWVIGHAYLRQRGAKEWVPSGVWYVREGSDIEQFKAATMRTPYRQGEGLVGAVAEMGEPLWVENVYQDPRWPHHYLTQFTATSAILFPVGALGPAEAVLEFYSDRPIAPDPAFLAVMANVGIQLGHALERKELERQILQVADEEQREIGEELHDQLGQSISALGMLAQSLRQKMGDTSGPVGDAVQAVISGIEDARLHVRLLSKGLIPLEVEASGLPGALTELAARCARIYGIECRFEGDETFAVHDGLAATQLFRIGARGRS